MGDSPKGPQARDPSTESTEIVAPAAVRAALWANIPAELRALPQWCIAGSDKAPRTPTGALASSTDPSTWTDFETAAWAAFQRGLNIGFVLTANDPYTCIDLDVKDETTPDQIARFVAIQQAADSYSERSMRGRGLHLWIRASIGLGRKRDGVEVYSQARFIICTGDVYEHKPIADRQELALHLIAQMPETTCGADLVELPAVESDEAVYWRARSYEPKAWPGKFDALWQGLWREMGYPSQSEADMALVGMLCAASPSNDQVRRTFLMSGLGQTIQRHPNPKDYLNRTLRKPRAQQADAAQARAGWQL